MRNVQLQDLKVFLLARSVTDRREHDMAIWSSQIMIPATYIYIYDFICIYIYSIAKDYMYCMYIYILQIINKYEYLYMYTYLYIFRCCTYDN